MSRLRIKMLGVVVALLCVVIPTWAESPGEDQPALDIPRLDGITIDGNGDDWGRRGYRVEMLSYGAKFPTHADSDGRFRIGWNDRGLLVLISVTDDVVWEQKSLAGFWGVLLPGDGIVLLVATDKRERGYFARISPGVTSEFPDIRTDFLTSVGTAGPADGYAIDAARAKTDSGYVIEVLLPWKNLGIKPVLGDVVRFNLVLNDRDPEGPTKPKATYTVAKWIPCRGEKDLSPFPRLRLARKADRAQLAVVSGQFREMRRTEIRVVGAAELIGKRVKIKRGWRTPVSTCFEEQNGRALADISLPVPAIGEEWEPMQVALRHHPRLVVDLPTVTTDRAKAAISAPILFQPYCFAGEEFPRCDFEQPSHMEHDIIGPYSIKTTFYDAQFNKVETPEKPGRYGAIVDIAAKDGRTFRRFRTLYRVPEEVTWWRMELDMSATLPENLGVDRRAATRQERDVRNGFKDAFGEYLDRNAGGAALLAGLSETDPEGPPTDMSNNTGAMDRQWWVDFKRKFYKTDTTYPEPFVCPRPIEGPPAPVVREGSLAEAGMKADTAEKIDAVCQEWSEDTDEAFAVCVVRHGVIVHNKAYGKRDGTSMTLTTKSWMASITKLMSGSLMMMLVDQGKVDLDTPIDAYLPALRGIEVKTPLTIRHLYTHTNGFWDHWGDWDNDLEEIVAEYYPRLQVGKEYSYNGVGYAIGGKIIETISGEAIPQFYKNHLLGPLGCKNTDVAGTAGDAASVPLDIAKIGQMLLNRGAYGNMRFYSEETFAQQMPTTLTMVLGPDTKTVWGIGTEWTPTVEGLGEGAFAHGAASGATFRIAPAIDAVIVMTRNAAGKNHGKYHPRFLEAIVKGIDDRK